MIEATRRQRQRELGFQRQSDFIGFRDPSKNALLKISGQTVLIFPSLTAWINLVAWMQGTRFIADLLFNDGHFPTIWSLKLTASDGQFARQ
ncbi:hypothetical protein [Phyllobacterium sp.]|uniref:hypothetical protein n=1 Tax=unclassified Phyllobacterium TaxID=2638441 RepID=UPI0031FDB29A|nr:hypothetical protein [Phyllobacterium sp.]